MIKYTIRIWYDKLLVLTPSKMSTHGRFFVLYPDGKQSQLFDYLTALDYRDIFGGDIIHKPTGKHIR